MHPFKESVRFYTGHFEYMSLLSLTVLLPFLLAHNVISGYVYRVTAFSGSSAFGDLSNAFLMLLFLVVAQLPFIQFVHSDLEGETHRLRASYRTFFRYGFSFFLFGILYVLAVFIGTALFVIPGLIVLTLFYLVPYVSIIEDQSLMKSLRPAMRTGKAHFFKLLGLILLTSFVEWLISLGSIIGISFVTNSYGAVIVSQFILNLIIFPYVVVLFTMFARKWLDNAFA